MLLSNSLVDYDPQLVEDMKSLPLLKKYLEKIIDLHFMNAKGDVVVRRRLNLMVLFLDTVFLLMLLLKKLIIFLLRPVAIQMAQAIQNVLMCWKGTKFSFKQVEFSLLLDY